MPILIKRDSSTDLVDLARQSGKARGQMEARQRQQQIDNQFIGFALQNAGSSRGAYGSNPGDFGYSPNGVGQQNQPGTGGVATFVNEEARAAAPYDNLEQLATRDPDQALTIAQGMKANSPESQFKIARAIATATAEKRKMFAAAAQQGPEALAAFLAADQYAGGDNIGGPLLDRLAPKPGRPTAAGGTGSTRDTRQVSQYQRDVEQSLGMGSADSLAGLGATEFSKSGDEVPTQESIQTQNALAHAAMTMDPSALRTLRAEVASSPISEQAKSRSLQIIDGQLAQKQKVRDVQLNQVLEQVQPQVMARIRQEVTAGSKTGVVPSRGEQLEKAGKLIIQEFGKYGISPAEVDDFLGRMQQTRDMMRDQQALMGGGGQPQQPNARPTSSRFNPRE